jgi:uncharacterized protein (DUF58 family)
LNFNALALVAPLVLLLAALAWRWHIYPHRSLVLAATVPALLSMGLIAWPRQGWPVVLAMDSLLILVALVDFWTLARPREFPIERHVGLIASIAKPHPVRLILANKSGRAQTVWIRDGLPVQLSADPEEMAVTLPAGNRCTIEYHLRAKRRGAFEWTAIHLRLLSRWGLWQRFFQQPASSRVNVYPDMQQLAKYALLARTDRLSQMGVRRSRRLGQDSEFERLRDYTPDDQYKHIDWRSTARRNKLTVKDFQANQSQRIIFLIDTGRMMTGEACGLSLLDHALDAMLMLSHVALRQGDQVGLISFSDRIHTFIPPRGGMGQMNRLLHGSFDRFPRMVESRYDDAFLYLGAHIRKRSLVVLITNVIDEVNANQVQRYLSTFSRHHLTMAVLLRNRQMFAAVENIDALLAGPNDRVLYEGAAAADILSWRAQVLADLQQKGVLALDLFPEEMTAPLVNRYLEIKARHLL